MITRMIWMIRMTVGELPAPGARSARSAPAGTGEKVARDYAEGAVSGDLITGIDDTPRPRIKK